MGINDGEIGIKHTHFLSRKFFWVWRLQIVNHLVEASVLHKCTQLEMILGDLVRNCHIRYCSYLETWLLTNTFKTYFLLEVMTKILNSTLILQMAVSVFVHKSVHWCSVGPCGVIALGHHWIRYWYLLPVSVWHHVIIRHDDVIKWNINALLVLCAGIHRSPVNSPHKGQWRRALMFSLICSWINVWVNNGEAGDLRRHRAHYDFIVMNQCRRIVLTSMLYKTLQIVVFIKLFLPCPRYLTADRLSLIQMVCLCICLRINSCRAECSLRNIITFHIFFLAPVVKVVSR